MNETDMCVLGDFIDPECIDFEGSLSFTVKAGYIQKEKLWKSKDLTAEFLGSFWKHMLDLESVESTLHFICAELLENAVNYSLKSDYLIVIQLCFKSDELLVYVRNSAKIEQAEKLKTFIRPILEAENLQQMFVQRIKAAKKHGGKKSQVGLIVLTKDRRAKLSWKIERKGDMAQVTTMAKISLNDFVKSTAGAEAGGL